MYELLEHQSEIGIRAYSTTIEESFSEASKALFSIMTEINKVEEIESSNIAVKAKNIEELFAQLLNELIFMMNVNNSFYSKFEYKIEKNENEFELNGVIYGEKIDIDKHEIKTEVKAATYSGLKVWEENNNKYVQIIVDV
jgi:SHS2 domain-containing protein